MSVAGSENLSSRPSAKPLAWALLISLGVHGIALVLIPVAYTMLAILAARHLTAEQLKQLQHPPKPAVTQELPLVFVEVDPSQATTEPPKNAKYYSAQNAKAANPDAKVKTTTPKIEGKQTRVVKTETVHKPKAFPLQPSAPKPPAPEEKEETKPKSGPKVGDLALAKPAEKPTDDPQVGEKPEPKRVRPRTIAEAEAQKQTIVGEKIKQDGGVKRRHLLPSFDTQSSKFGSYDAAFIRAVSQHWYDLVDSQAASSMRSGKVVLEFNLNYDGRITDMKVLDGQVDELLIYLCKRAILDPAPFEKWPNEMRREIGSDVREVRFTFYYE